MKSIGAMTALILFLPFAASARESGASAAANLYTCSAQGLSRVALQIGPAPCCDRQIRCAQLLSTQSLLDKRRDDRT